MPSFELVSLEEAILRSTLTGKRGGIIKEYLGYIDRLGEGQAGKLRAGEGENPGAIRRRLGAAAKLVGKELVIKRDGDDVYCWLQQGEETKPKRGRPPGPRKSEA